MSTRKSVAASITAQNTFTKLLSINANERASVSISGTFVGTVTLQRRLDGANWRDVNPWTSPDDPTYVADESGDIRLGIKTGDYTSGTAVCRLGIG